jgi:3-hydroxyethyl bacteriochlorophyllide a dehydrogenase
MDTIAVVLEAPEQLSLRSLGLCDAAPNDVVVNVDFSGISTGTERLLWSGKMPPFPGLAYPLVPGYESVGRIVDAGIDAKSRIGETVFIPGSTGFIGARGLFGGAARRLVAPSARVISIGENLAQTGVLIALAATARHAIADGANPPELIVGHGVLGRLLARIVIAEHGFAHVVWETNPARQNGARGYEVTDANFDDRKDYKTILDASGSGDMLDTFISRLARGGEVVLAGFYDQISFKFPPAFMREARIRIASEWTPADLAATLDLIQTGRLSLDGLITHEASYDQADGAYRTAFSDPACLKMLLDWRDAA